MASRIFTPVLYLPSLNPGGLAIHDGYAYIVDRGWPAQDLVGNVNDEPEQTRGGRIVKINLTTRRLVEDDAWPSTALVTTSGAPSLKPYFGPFINGEWMYVCAHGSRESAPDARVNGDEQTGSVHRLRVSDGAPVGDPATTNLDGPFSIAFDSGNHVYVTNTRVAEANNKIIHFDADLTDATSVSLNLQGDPAPRALGEAGGVLFRRENNQDVLYVTDRGDDPAVARGTDPPVAAQRGHIIRIVLGGQNNATVYANDLDRPIALAFDPEDDQAYILCAWPRSRREIGVSPAGGGERCLPPWRTWRNPLGTIRRASRPNPATSLATVSDFAPALVDPRGLAIREEDGESFLYVITAAGPPPTPPDVDADVTTVCGAAQTWPWAAPPSGMLYKVSLA